MKTVMRTKTGSIVLASEPYKSRGQWFRRVWSAAKSTGGAAWKVIGAPRVLSADELEACV